jgi:hypothetical protein
MRDLIDRLRNRWEDSGLESDLQDAFKLLLFACSACCTETDGGNKTCPPKKIEAE